MALQSLQQQIMAHAVESLAQVNKSNSSVLLCVFCQAWSWLIVPDHACVQPIMAHLYERAKSTDETKVRRSSARMSAVRWDSGAKKNWQLPEWRQYEKDTVKCMPCTAFTTKAGVMGSSKPLFSFNYNPFPNPNLTVDPSVLLAFEQLASHWSRLHFCPSLSCRDTS